MICQYSLKFYEIKSQLQKGNESILCSTPIPRMCIESLEKKGILMLKKTPPKQEVKDFWENIWSKKGTISQENTWINDVRENYCKDVVTCINEIKFEQFNKVNENLNYGTRRGLDLTTGFWVKRCRSMRQATFNIFKNISNGEDTVPEWLIRTQTVLLPKNKDTHNPKNYRPIACENILLKTYTGTIAQLIDQHLTENSIIFPEQAGAKKGSWGCIDQLMVNKVMTDETKKGLKNLCMVWLDYKKAYDSVPHAWILGALRLAKIPELGQ